MEQYYEQTVQKVPTTKEKVLAVLVWVGAVALSAVGFYLMVFRFPQYGGSLLAILFTVMLIMLALLYSKRLNPEFCYEFIDGYINIDKIQKKGIRTTLSRIRFSHITAFGRYTPDKKRKYKPYHTYSTFTGRTKDLWFTVCVYERKKDMVIFEPDEKMLELIKNSLPVQLRLAAFGKGRDAEQGT